MVKLEGYVLHMFDSKANHDKFYRIFTFEQDGRSCLVTGWGRDGTKGSVKEEWFNDERRAALHKKASLARKVKRGYRVLGEGSCTVQSGLTTLEMGERLNTWIGRDPIKADGFVIREEPDIEDLLTV